MPVTNSHANPNACRPPKALPSQEVAAALLAIRMAISLAASSSKSAASDALMIHVFGAVLPSNCWMRYEWTLCVCIVSGRGMAPWQRRVNGLATAAGFKPEATESMRMPDAMPLKPHYCLQFMKYCHVGSTGGSTSGQTSARSKDINGEWERSVFRDVTA